MAHSLGLTVVAEGVETPLQLEYLQSQGCDEFQGFIVSKPVPPAEFAARFLGVTSPTADAKVVPVDDVPTITGEATVDQVLRVDTSGINDIGDPSAISYQWLRNNIAIGGADESTYAPYGADVGKRITVQISYTDAQGTTKSPLTSMPTEKVLGAGAAGKGTASLSNTATGIGMPIASFTLADDDEPDQLESNSPDIPGGAIDENTSSDLTAALDFADDAPSEVLDITVAATESQAPLVDVLRVSDDNDADPLQSSGLDIPAGDLDETTSIDLTAPLPFVDDATSGVPDVTGTATESPLPRADMSSIGDGNDSDPLQSPDLDIFGGDFDEATSIDLTAPLSIVDDTPAKIPATAGTATERQVPLGDTLSISDDNDSDQLQSPGLDFIGSTVDETKSNDRAAPLSIVDDVPVELPAISGNAIEGQVLSVDTSPISDADELGAFSFQWMRNNVVIDSATASIYSLNDSDVGARISVQVSYTDAQGATKDPLTSMQTTEVVAVKDEPAGELRLAGTSPTS